MSFAYEADLCSFPIGMIIAFHLITPSRYQVRQLWQIYSLIGVKSIESEDKRLPATLLFNREIYG